MMSTKACLHPTPDSSRHFCKCHERMGNDFWFLPVDSCLFQNTEGSEESAPKRAEKPRRVA